MMVHENLDFLLDCAAYDHAGDRKALENIFIAAATQRDIHTQGIQVSLSGKFGNGKTDLIRTALNIIGEGHYIEANMSDKNIFYASDIHDAQIVFCDDKELSRDLEGTVKRAASNFQMPCVHRTIDSNLRPVAYIMPSRLIWVFTSVSETKSDELLSRCIQLIIDESDTQTDRVSSLIRKKAMMHKGEHYLSNRDLRKCHNIWDDIRSKWYIVNIPDAEKVSGNGRRALKMSMDRVRGYAILDYGNRDMVIESL